MTTLRAETRIASDGTRTTVKAGTPLGSDFSIGWRCAPRPPRPCAIDDCRLMFEPRVHSQIVCDAHSWRERRRFLQARATARRQH